METLEQLAGVTGEQGPIGRGSALTTLLTWVVDARHAKADAADVLRIEESVIASTFGGDRSAYEAALADRKATVTLARALIADELRRVRIERSLPRSSSYERWVRSKQGEILRAAVCQIDELPAAGVVDVTSYLPFLRGADTG